MVLVASDNAMLEIPSHVLYLKLSVVIVMSMGDPRGTPQCTGIRSVLLQRCQQPGLLDTHDWACSLLRSIPAEKARSPKCCGLVPALLFSRRKVFETSLAFLPGLASIGKKHPWDQLQPLKKKNRLEKIQFLKVLPSLRVEPQSFSLLTRGNNFKTKLIYHLPTSKTSSMHWKKRKRSLSKKRK